MAFPAETPPPSPPKKPYRPPEFVVYGPLADLTKGGPFVAGFEGDSFRVS
jgi:hypothetical protein